MVGTRFLVWLDGECARIVEVRDGATRAIRVESKAVVDGWDANELAEMYLFDEIADVVEEGTEIVLASEGWQRFQLRDYLRRHRPSIGERVIGLEKIADVTDTMLRTFTRTYFRITDRR
ncbi:MAG: hypothetical protein JWL72_4420 [Ilumatobacteraceae bacterium]|nr:hypothetical protein [Ilumatobacteraceae bacterium]